MPVAMRVLVYLRDPDTEIVLVTGRRTAEGAHRGRPVFTEAELESVLDMKPTPAEFRVICAAKVALSGSVVSVSGQQRQQPLLSGDADYSSEDEFIS